MEKSDCVIVVDKIFSKLDFFGEQSDDDDCVILDGDPDNPVSVVVEDNRDWDGSGDLIIVGEKGQVACRDFPHPRHLCANFPFNTTPHKKHCGQCHCYVCESPAPCIYWGYGLSRDDHCHSTDEDGEWKARRELSKQRQTEVHSRKLPDATTFQPRMSMAVQQQGVVAEPVVAKAGMSMAVQQQGGVVAKLGRGGLRGGLVGEPGMSMAVQQQGGVVAEPVVAKAGMSMAVQQQGGVVAKLGRGGLRGGLVGGDAEPGMSMAVQQQGGVVAKAGMSMAVQQQGGVVAKLWRGGLRGGLVGGDAEPGMSMAVQQQGGVVAKAGMSMAVQQQGGVVAKLGRGGLRGGLVGDAEPGMSMAVQQQGGVVAKAGMSMAVQQQGGVVAKLGRGGLRGGLVGDAEPGMSMAVQQQGGVVAKAGMSKAVQQQGGVVAKLGMSKAVQQQGGVVAKPRMRKPVFTKVDQLRPDTSGHTLTVKVVTAKTVLQKGRAASAHLRETRIAECLVGDDAGTIVFTARNEQVDLMQPGATVILRNAKIDMFKGSMRLAVDKWGRVEVTEPANFTVKEDNNLSLVVEYERVNEVEE